LRNQLADRRTRPALLEHLSKELASSGKSPAYGDGRKNHPAARNSVAGFFDRGASRDRGGDPILLKTI
jgi:hypothetical protein